MSDSKTQYEIASDLDIQHIQIVNDGSIPDTWLKTKNAQGFTTWLRPVIGSDSKTVYEAIEINEGLAASHGEDYYIGIKETPNGKGESVYMRPITVNQQGGWVNCADRLPDLITTFDYGDNSEPQIIFKNIEHDACFVWYKSLGYLPMTQLNQNDWPLNTWRWLDESQPIHTGEEKSTIDVWTTESLSLLDWSLTGIKILQTICDKISLSGGSTKSKELIGEIENFLSASKYKSE